MLNKITRWLVNQIILLARLKPDDHLHHADGSLYMARFWLVRTRWFAVRVHHIATCDIDRHFHDHPWGFISVVLRGGYQEARPISIDPCFVEGAEHEQCVIQARRAGSIALRRRTDRHRIISVLPETWTLVVLGKKHQWWGFFTPAGKVYWKDYQTTDIASSKRVSVVQVLSMVRNRQLAARNREIANN